MKKYHQLTVFPSAKSAVIVGGYARYGVDVLPRQLHRGAKLHRVTKTLFAKSLLRNAIVKFML